MRPCSAALALLAACARAPAPAATVEGAPPGPPGPCDDPARLLDAVAAAWHRARPGLELTACVPGRPRGGDALVVALARHRDVEGDQVDQLVGVVAAGAYRIARFSADSITPPAPADWTLVDLDGDGADEALAVEHHVDDLGERRRIALWLLGGEPEQTSTVALDADTTRGELRGGPKLGRCSGTHRIVEVDGARQLEIVSAVQRGRPARAVCLPGGRHRFVVRDGALVEVE